MFRLSNPAIKVSSVLNRDTRSYGKKHLIDGNDETCWNSDQGVNQYIQISLSEPQSIKLIRIMFQGGFAARKCSFEAEGSDTIIFNPLDNNTLQEFYIYSNVCQTFKVTFLEPTDFYGRMTVYDFDIEFSVRS